MPPVPQELRHDNPFRSLDWRWQLAQQPAPPRRSQRQTADTPTPATGDEWIAAARDYLHGGGAAPCPTGIGGAIILRDGGGRTRWEVEALLLANMPFSGIAKRCRIPVRVIEAFHALVFDVRDRLQEHDWISENVIRRGPDGVCGHGDIWKRVAFEQGVLKLDAFMAVSLNRKLPKKYVTLLGPYREHAEAYEWARIKLLIGREVARTDEQRAEVRSHELKVNKLRVMVYGEESPAQQAVRMMEEGLLFSSKLFQAAMRKAEREKANT